MTGSPEAACSLCLEDLSEVDGSDVIALHPKESHVSLRHIQHRACFEEFLTGPASSLCPVCRRQIDQAVVDLFRLSRNEFLCTHGPDQPYILPPDLNAVEQEDAGYLMLLALANNHPVYVTAISAQHQHINLEQAYMMLTDTSLLKRVFSACVSNLARRTDPADKAAYLSCFPTKFKQDLLLQLHLISAPVSTIDLRAILESGVHVNAVDQEGNVHLHHWVLQGRQDAVETLISCGASVQLAGKYGHTPLIHAAKEGHLCLVRLLLTKGATVDIQNQFGQTALIKAAEKGHMDVVRELLKAGADVQTARKDGWTALMEASFRGHMTVVKVLVDSGAQLEAQNSYGWTACMCAAAQNQLAVLDFLVSAGANVNQVDNQGEDAIMLAARNGHLAVIKCLAAKQGAMLGRENTSGWNALFLACRYGHQDVCETLMVMDAFMESQRSYGPGQRCLLALACSRGYLSLARMLAESPHQRQLFAGDKSDALVKVCQQGHTDMLAFMLDDLGLHPDTTFLDHRLTPLTEACRWGHAAIIELLVRHGADIRYRDAQSGRAMQVRM